jgi:hypothetical protein
MIFLNVSPDNFGTGLILLIYVMKIPHKWDTENRYKNSEFNGLN